MSAEGWFCSKWCLTFKVKGLFLHQGMGQGRGTLRCFFNAALYCIGVLNLHVLLIDLARILVSHYPVVDPQSPHASCSPW